MDEPFAPVPRHATQLLVLGLLGLATFGGAALGMLTMRNDNAPPAQTAIPYAATFDDAARALRAGRAAEAYGRLWHS